MTTDAQRRNLNHNRQIMYNSFERFDGLFDIEGTLRDSKGFKYPDRERGLLEIGEPVHDIFARISLSQNYIVERFEYKMNAVPFNYCLGAVDTNLLLGACIARGWRKSINEAFGAHGGCSHLRELVFGMGTVAFQTIFAAMEMRRYQEGTHDSAVTERPFFIGGCHSWSEDSPVTKLWFPQFATRRE